MIFIKFWHEVGIKRKPISVPEKTQINKAVYAITLLDWPGEFSQVKIYKETCI